MNPNYLVHRAEHPLTRAEQRPRIFARPSWPDH